MGKANDFWCFNRIIILNTFASAASIWLFIFNLPLAQYPNFMEVQY